MPAIIETTNAISQIADNLIDFLVKDSKLSAEFEEYLKINEIEIQKESELTDIIMEYIFDGRMKDGTRVLDYYSKLNPDCADEKILFALRNSFISVFQIKRIQKNAFETTCLISEKDFTLVPLVKTTSLRGIGQNDYIKARVIEIDNNYYLLEIHDVLGSLKEWDAAREAVLRIIEAPNTAVLNNKDKFLQIKESTESFNSSFLEAFRADEIIVSSKKADNILNEFYLYHTGKIQEPPKFESYNEADCRFIEIKEFKKDIVQNTYTGFNSTEDTYDTGIYADKDFGIFVIPFLGTFNKILKENSLEKTENAKECLFDFLKSRKVPIGLIVKKAEEYPNFVELISKLQGKDFTSIQDIIEFYRPDYAEIKTKMNFSPVMVLYNSKAFSRFLNKKNEQKELAIGRNDPCPCGSGKKYKKCCLLKEEK